ncbi:MAG: hypothetical protein LBQ60_09655 [Bacteroidales bacterium]|nr:hypothetical protein [Bacteroidales bacterium]
MKNLQKQGSKIWLFLIVFLMVSCGKKTEKKIEQLTYNEFQQNMPTGIATKDNPTYGQLTSSSNSVLLTGIDRIRLIPIYKINPKTDKDVQYGLGMTYFSYWDKDEEDYYKYFMPGIDIVYGYNLINIGHYDIETEKLSYFFENPVLIRTLYFPGLKRDSLRHQPVSRDYFLVSVYDEDTNQDSLINTKDMRKFYHIDQFNHKKT